MAIPPAPAGYQRFLMKSKFGMGRDFRILDPATEADVYMVDGKVGPRPRADVLDAAGTKLFEVTGKMLGIPKRMDVTDANGGQVAHLHAQAFKIVRDKVEITLANGEEWLSVGNIVEKDYVVRDASGAVKIQVTQKWVTIRDKYTIDVAAGVEPAVAFALVWAIDRWVERD